MRIGYVLKRYPRYSETFIVNEILAHEAAGFEVEIFSLRPPNDPRFQEAISRVQAPVTYIPSGGSKVADFWLGLQQAAKLLPGFWRKLEWAGDTSSRDLLQAVHLACEARNRGVNHLHAHFATVATTVARLAGEFADLPYTFTAHAKDIFHDDVSPEDLGRKLSDAAAVITVSDFNLEFLRETYGAASARVRRIYNGLTLDRFPFEDPQSRPPHIVAVGRLIEKKGFSVLIDACAELAGQGKHFSCTLIGTGPLEAELAAQIRQHGLGGRVMLAGPKPLPDVIAELRGAAAMACPCVIGADGDRDGLPTVLLEAMALGTPCIGTDVTGLPEVLHDEETGLMVPQHDPIALAEAIERLLEDSDLRSALAIRARKLIEDEFDIQRNAARQRSTFAAAGESERRTVAEAS